MQWIANKGVDSPTVESLLQEPLRTNQFTNGGENARRLEKYIHDEFGIDDSKAVVVVANGSVAIHALASGVDYTTGRELQWATQAFTFPSSAQSNLRGVKIIDIDEDGGLDLGQVDDSIQGIIVTNIFGNVVDIGKYEAYCAERNKYLIFDNAATAHTFYKGKNSLNYGVGATISFHHTKPFGFGEGGAIIVDKKYEKAIRCLNNFGIGLTDRYWVSEGNNNKMSEIAAIYILQYLKHSKDTIVEKHGELMNRFVKEMARRDITHFKMFPSFHDTCMVPSCFSLLFDEYDESFLERLLAKGINARKYYHPLDESRVANETFDRILCLPCNIDMTNKDIETIFDVLSL